MSGLPGDVVRPVPPLRSARRTALVAGIVALSVAALLGIVILMGAEFGELQARVLFTALVVAAFCVATLGNLAAIGRSPVLLPVLGTVTAGIALLIALYFIWIASLEPLGWEHVETLAKTLGVCIVLCVLFTHAGLMVGLLRGGGAGIQLGVAGTLIVTTALATIVIVLILASGDWAGDWLPRTIGILSILAALGTIALPIAASVGNSRRAARAAHGSQRVGAGGAAPVGAPNRVGEGLSPEAGIVLPAGLADRAQRQASARGVSVEQLLDDLLD